MKNCKSIRKLFAVALAFVIAVTSLSTSAFATEVPNFDDESVVYNSFPVGDHYVGYCTVNNYHYGGYHYFYGSNIQLKPAWKATDSQTSEIDMYIRLIDVDCNTVAYSHLFTISEDIDGKDSAGYWYAEGPWEPIHSGHKYQFYYEAFTSANNTPTGNPRRGTCSLWINIS